MKLQYSKLLLFSFSIFLFLEGLDAYSINNIPIFWLGVSFFLFVFLGLHFFGFKASSYNFVSLRNWVLYGIFITLIQSFFNDVVLPKYASTTYFQYISLRLLRLVFFLAVIYCLDYILQKYNFEYVLTFFLLSCLFISVLSLISYFSYVYGYNDFPRTRSGSGGWTQPIERACNILRNYGTFREPSFLSIWSVPFLPYFFYLGKKKRVWYFLSLIPILSIVGVLNDNYQGGEFIMFDDYEIKFKPGDIIIFPSVFLYPHLVKPVTKGTRYSLVSWTW